MPECVRVCAYVRMRTDVHARQSTGRILISSKKLHMARSRIRREAEGEEEGRKSPSPSVF